MRHHPFHRPGLFLLITLLISGWCQAQEAPARLTQADLDAAVETIKQYLYETQDESGAWYGAYHTGPDDVADNRNAWGPTAMATLALLKAGEDPQREEIAKALKILADHPIDGTYAYCMRAHVWAQLPDAYLPKLRDDLVTMLQSVSPVKQINESNFNYFVAAAERFNHGGSRIDNSTTQYGVLAIWEAQQRGLRVPEAFWMDVAEGFLNMQKPDGGWSYSNQANTTQSMTLAGLTCLLIAQQQLFDQERHANAKMTTSIEAGLAYLDRNFDPEQMRTHGGSSYTYLGYARVAELTGKTHFANQAWHETIARNIIAGNGQFGASVHNAAFELMVLASMQKPIWINKLTHPDMLTNNRPNDIYQLNRSMSLAVDRELAWQQADLSDADARAWMRVPLAWFSTDDAFAFSAQEVSRLRDYFKAGGTLIINVESSNRKAQASTRDLAQQLFPDATFQPVPADHALFQMPEDLHVAPDDLGRSGMSMIADDTRPLIILLNDDWGLTLQHNPQGLHNLRANDKHYRDQRLAILKNLFDKITKHIDLPTLVPAE